jgi:AraC family transcriptional regulator of arabinose operon
MERALAGFYYSLSRGIEISPDLGRDALLAFNRMAAPAWPAKRAPDPDPEAHLRAFLENSRQSGFVGLCRQWESNFDRRGLPLPGADVRRFLKEAMRLQHHSPHTHHDFFCIGPSFEPGAVMDFRIEHPFAADFWTVCLTDDGVGLVENKLGPLATLPRGALALIPPGFSGHVGRDVGAARWRCHYLGFRAKPQWLDFLGAAFARQTPTVVNIELAGEMQMFRRSFRELSTTVYQRGDINESLCFNVIENLLLRVDRLHKSSANKESGAAHFPPSDARIGAAVEFVLGHYTEPLKIAEIAAEANLSPSRLGVLFKRDYGMGVMQWRDSLRLRKARDLLAHTDLKIAEISQRVGWDDQLYFSRRFKDKYGAAPRHYRQRISKGNRG